MTYQFDGFNYVVRLEKGELLMQSLTKLVADKQIAGAWISGLGAALWAELGYYDLEAQEYIWKLIDKTVEITGLHGNVAWLDNEPKLHIHGSFSDRDMRALGGHVKELAVGGTAEIFLHLLQAEQKLERAQDKKIGLPLLQLQKNS